MKIRRFLTFKIKFQQIKTWWQRKNPAEKWDSIINFGKTFGNLIGVRVLGDVRVNWFSSLCAICGVIFFALVLYTFQYDLRRGAFVRAMESTYVVGIVVEVCAMV